MKARNPERLTNVIDSFQLVSLNPTENGIIYLRGGGTLSDLFYDHIQGYAQNGSMRFLSVNQVEEPYGTIFVYQDNEINGVLKIPIEGFNHPSGIQPIGDFLVVPIQTGDYQQAKVYCINTASIQGDSFEGFELQGIPPLDTAASLGVTDVNLQADGSFQYLVIITGRNDGSLYLSERTTTLRSDLSFTKLPIHKANFNYVLSFQGIQLLTQADGKVFVVAFDSTNEADFFFKDYLRLYELSGPLDGGNTVDITYISSLHLFSDEGDTPLIPPLKPHCRFGSGVVVKGEQLSCFLTGREPHLEEELRGDFWTRWMAAIEKDIEEGKLDVAAKAFLIVIAEEIVELGNWNYPVLNLFKSILAGFTSDGRNDSDETAHGHWNNYYGTLLTFDQNGESYIIGNSNQFDGSAWSLDQLLADRVDELQGGDWNNFYGSAVVFEQGGQHFLFTLSSQFGDDYWCIITVGPDGISDNLSSGESGNFYGSMAAFEQDGKNYLFAQTEDSDYRWFTAEIDPYDSSWYNNEIANGNWGSYYGAALVFEENGKNYLFAHCSDRNGRWFISELKPNSDWNGAEVSKGYLNDYYSTIATFQKDGKNYLFAHSETDNQWFIAGLSASGGVKKLGKGTWNNFYGSAVAFEQNGKHYLYAQTSNDNRWFISRIVIL